MSGLSAVHGRIAEIQARFGATSGFGAALAQATTAAGARTPATTGLAIAPAPPSAAAATAPATFTAAALPPGAGAGALPAAAGNWAARLPAAGRAWAGAIESAATEAGVDPRLLAALTRAESNFRPDARSHAGATGLTQLMPATAAGLGVDPTDPVANLRGGARYLRQQLDRFGSPQLALAAYNAGPGRVASAGGIPRIAETQTYVARVMGYYQELGGTT